MAWNPTPEVADCRDIARKWGDQEQVIIIAIDGNGTTKMATYGKTMQLCRVAKVLGDAAFAAIAKRVEQAESQLRQQ
jgi:hypothetical protein